MTRVSHLFNQSCEESIVAGIVISHFNFKVHTTGMMWDRGLTQKILSPALGSFSKEPLEIGNYWPGMREIDMVSFAIIGRLIPLFVTNFSHPGELHYHY